MLGYKHTKEFLRIGAIMKKIYKLSPSLHANIWGGNKLRAFGKSSPEDRIGESWELSFVAGAEALADGVRLTEIFPRECWGTRAASFEDFPTLTKFIDAREKLSVQVHPDDTYAKLHEGGYGKSEMWYVVEADEGAGLYMGLQRKSTAEQIRAAVENGTVESLLSFKKVKAGDVFFIPAGTVHAIGAGVLIFEIQQNSTTTYRLYDYMRRDKSGNLRELHLEKALAVLTPDVYTEAKYEQDDAAVGKIIGSCPYFTTREYDLARGEAMITVGEESFVSLSAVRGEGEILYNDEGMIRSLHFSAGDSFFLPASQHAHTIKIKGNGTLLSVAL